MYPHVATTSSGNPRPRAEDIGSANVIHLGIHHSEPRLTPWWRRIHGVSPGRITLVLPITAATALQICTASPFSDSSTGCPGSA
ncbi:unnamed protein product [Macrosiphum euphorbiae]|uniref:Uncharacterized protein n=1 Tax=Macrosiphum euphorbiae TaxID=13131 RepID=A0AAV0W8L3_9HEMI|nr:unnamed protein product [Macrosiphum euphorbiae]